MNREVRVDVLRDFSYPRLWLGLWLLGLLATVIICLLPFPPSSSPYSHFDKVEHALGYAALAAGAAMLFATRAALALAVLGLIALGVGIEGLQMLVPWRSADPLDVLANALGALVGALTAATPMAGWLQRFDRVWR